MIRTIEEMERDDKICPESAISDVLAFCIVAGDFLRAKRKRFPTGKFMSAYDGLNVIESTTYNYHCELNTGIDELVCAVGDAACFCYFNVEPLKNGYYLWDYNIEYTDD